MGTNIRLKNRVWNAIIRIYTVVCGSAILKYHSKISALPFQWHHVHKPSFTKTLSPSFWLAFTRFRSGQRKGNQNNKGGQNQGVCLRSRTVDGELLRALSFRSQRSRLGSILISQVSTVCNSSLSRGGWASRSPPSPSHLTRPCPLPASTQSNTLSVTLFWLQRPNPLNVGKAWNDEELDFFYTGDVLCLSLWPTGSA